MKRALVIDIGGTSVKLGVDGNEFARVRSGLELTPARLCEFTLQHVHAMTFDAVTIGYPAAVSSTGSILTQSLYLGDGWLAFDFSAAFATPTRIINDAALQAIGSYQHGRMLYLGFGTGLGTALVADSTVIPLEAADLPYKNETFERLIGKSGFESLGKEVWLRCVYDVIPLLKHAFVADEIVSGGGHAALIDPLPAYCRRAGASNIYIGGARVWDEPCAFKIV